MLTGLHGAVRNPAPVYTAQAVGGAETAQSRRQRDELYLGWNEIKYSFNWAVLAE